MASKKPSGRKKSTTPKASSFNVKYFQYAVVIAACIAFYAYAKSITFIQDDSFITYRYVKNFTDGNGLVFNIGDRVEGYTCFLWVLLLSLFKTLGLNFISLSQASGVIFSFEI